jgi:hypothetical protein
MRSYPHKPKENLIKTFLADDIEDYEEGRLKAEDAAARRNEAFFRRHSELAAEIAAMKYAFEEEWAEIKAWLERSCSAARKAAEFGLPLDPDAYMMYLALALLSANHEFRKELEGFQRSRFTNENVEADEVFYLAAEAMRDVSAGRIDTARDATSAGLSRLEAKDGPNRDAKEAMEAILLMLAALVHKDEAKLGLAMMARSKEFGGGYSKAAVKNFPGGLLDITGLGLLRLGREKGLNAAAESVYLPSELLGSPNI